MYTNQTRDRFRLLVGATTGISALLSGLGLGGLAGEANSEYQNKKINQAQQQEVAKHKAALAYRLKLNRWRKQNPIVKLQDPEIVVHYSTQYLEPNNGSSPSYSGGSASISTGQNSYAPSASSSSSNSGNSGGTSSGSNSGGGVSSGGGNPPPNPPVPSTGS